ncbi:uncharacterized protein LOC115453196 [Manduca sexta]|nr:uncharacterized protein LOC115453196 [Manduca sexta]
MYTSVAVCDGQHITYQHPDGYRVIDIAINEDIDLEKRMERNELTLSFHNLIKRDEELYSYTNYGMDTPTPVTPGDCLPGLFQTMDSLTTALDSDLDESLAVPESLSVIDADKIDNKDNDAGSKWLIYCNLFHTHTHT